MANLIELKPIINLNPFARFCCTIGNLPTSYMASLTYEEQLMWLCDYLQNTVIPAVNNNAECVKELQELYVELKNYVDNYFINLDVQQEINNKLDEMADNGKLSTLLDRLFYELKANVDSKILMQDNKILELNNKILASYSGSPIPVDDISKMTDNSKIYLLTTDGYWYYFDITWKKGGIYLDSPNSQDLNKINKSFFTSLFLFTDLPKFNQVFTNDLDFKRFQDWYSTDFLPITPNNQYQEINTATFPSIYVYSFFDKDYNFISGVLGGSENNTLQKFTISNPPLNAKFIKFSYKNINNPFLSLTSSQVVNINLTDRLNTIDEKLSSYDNSFKLKPLLVDDKIYTPDGFRKFEQWFSTNYLNVSNVNIIKKLVVSAFPNLYSYAFFDEHYEFISGYLPNTGNTKTLYDIVVPSNAKFIRYIGSNTSGNSLDLEEVTYNYNYSINQSFIDINFLKDNYNNLSFINHLFNSFYFDNILCIGDSLTEGDYGSFPEGTPNIHKENYPYYLSKLLNSSVTNKGKSGYTTLNYWKNINTILNPSSNYDCIFIFLGMNGGFTDTISEDTNFDNYNDFADTNTGRYCSIIEWCKEHYKNSHIFLINLPFNNRSISWTKSTNEIIHKIALKYNLPLIDIMNNSPFTRDNGQIYRPVGFDEIKEPFGNLHFGRLGYLTLAYTIFNLLSQEINNNKLNYAL